MSILRTVALICVFAPLSAMLFEPFFETLFDHIEWDTEDFAVPFVTWVAGNTTLLVGLMGVGAGIWIHYLASKQWPSKTPQLSSELSPVTAEKSHATEGNSWAKGLQSISIRNAACAYTNINPESYESSSRAQAIAKEVLQKVRAGWVLTTKEYEATPKGGISAHLAGHPENEPNPTAKLDTEVIVGSLHRNYSTGRSDLNLDWIVEKNPEIVATIRS